MSLNRAEKSTIIDCSKSHPASSSLYSLYLLCDFVSGFTVIKAPEYGEASLQGTFWLEKALHYPGFCLSLDGKGAIHLSAVQCKEFFKLSAFRVYNSILILITGSVRTIRNQPVVSRWNSRLSDKSAAVWAELWNFTMGQREKYYVSWAAIDIQQDANLTFVLTLLLACIIHQTTVPKQKGLWASNQQHGQLMRSSKAY